MKNAAHRRALAAGAAAAGLLLGLLAASARSVAAPQQQGLESGRALQGTIDIHVHSYPDNVERSVDGFEAATQAKAGGMRGIVPKNHYDPTGGLAWIVRKQVPGLEVFGGIDLNLPVGGMNVAAVEHLAQVTGAWGQMVWMSTFDAEVGTSPETSGS